MQKRKMFCWGLALMLTASSCSRKSESRDAEPVRVKTMAVGQSPMVNGSSQSEAAEPNASGSNGSNGSMSGGRVYSGTIEEASATSLSFAVPGTVRQVLVSEGQRVGKGQLLAVLDETSLRSSHASAQAALAQAEDAYQRMKQLHDSGSLPDIQWVDVESKLQQARSLEEIARKQLADGRLYAPAAGIVSRKGVEPGQTVAPGIEVLRLLDVSSVKMTISVPEREIGSMALGTEGTATVDALDGRRYAVRVSEKGTTASPLSRSYSVKFNIGNGDGALKPGMLCSVMLAGEPSEADLVLPATAVMLTERNTHYVWTVTDGHARRRDVTIGGTATGGVVIAAGLTASDTVIVEGMQKVYEGCTVKEIEQL